MVGLHRSDICTNFICTSAIYINSIMNQLRFDAILKISRSYFRHDPSRRLAPARGLHLNRTNQCSCLVRLLICLLECARASGRCKGEVFGRTRPSAAMCMQKPRQCNRCSRHTRARGGEAGPAGGQWCSARTSSARSLRMRRARNRLSVTFVASQSAGMLVGGGFLVFRRRRVCAGFSAICRRK